MVTRLGRLGGEIVGVEIRVVALLHHPEDVVAIDPVVAAEAVQVEAALLLDRVAVDEPAKGGTVISLARYCSGEPPTRVIVSGVKT